MAKQEKAGGEEGKPFVGVPSDQVGRGAGMDPPGDPGDDAEACAAAVQELKRNAGDQQIGSGGPGQSASESTKKTSDEDISSATRPPSDS